MKTRGWRHWTSGPEKDVVHKESHSTQAHAQLALWSPRSRSYSCKRLCPYIWYYVQPLYWTANNPPHLSFSSWRGGSSLVFLFVFHFTKIATANGLILANLSTHDRNFPCPQVEPRTHLLRRCKISSWDVDWNNLKKVAPTHTENKLKKKTKKKAQHDSSCNADGLRRGRGSVRRIKGHA